MYSVTVFEQKVGFGNLKRSLVMQYFFGDIFSYIYILTGEGVLVFLDGKWRKQ